MCAEVVTPDKGKFTSPVEKVYINVPGAGTDTELQRMKVPYRFFITHDNVTQDTTKMNGLPMPTFNIECNIDNINCNIEKAFEGYCIIHECSLPIKSVELQFMRKEKTTQHQMKLNEMSEIQNLQVGDGNVNKGQEIPLYMLFPKIFSCANIKANDTEVTFAMNVIVVLVNGLVISDNFPINLFRV